MKISRPFKEGHDFDYLRGVIMREKKGGPVPIIELGVDTELMAEISGFDYPADKAGDPIYTYIRNAALAADYSEFKDEQIEKLMEVTPEAQQEELGLAVKLMDLSLEFSKAAGYDYVTVYPLVPLVRTRARHTANPQQKDKVRAWQDEHSGLITSRKEFEAFPWPSTDRISLLAVDFLAPKMPEGMKVMVFYLGIFEDLKLLMGFENMAIESIEEPELLGDILERLTVLAEAAVEKSAAHPAVGAVFYAEDMGFKTGTMLSPAWMKEWVIPRHKRIAEACKKHGKPFLFHSCGRIYALMEDLIEDVGIDGFHSFQDGIEPVESFYEKYGDRISILGGLDVDLLARGTEEQVRRRARQILDACGDTGGYCMGSGNSVTNYCRVENYYAMLDETRKWNREHFGREY